MGFITAKFICVVSIIHYNVAAVARRLGFSVHAGVLRWLTKRASVFRVSRWSVGIF